MGIGVLFFGYFFYLPLSYNGFDLLPDIISVLIMFSALRWLSFYCPGNRFFRLAKVIMVPMGALSVGMFGCQAANAVSIPVLGMGGVQNTEDALEFLMAGATMVAVGTANFFNPYVTSQIIDGLEEYVKKEKLSSIRDIIGCVK